VLVKEVRIAALIEFEVDGVRFIQPAIDQFRDGTVE